MSFQEKNITASLVSFTLILGFFLIRLFQLVRGDIFTSSNVFYLWGIVIVLAIVATILITILAHIISAIVQSIQTGDENPEIEDISDERDKLVDLRGTQVTYIVFSIGVFFAMLTFVLGQPALVMFTLLIFFGILASVIGDTSRLVLYRRGV
jgi:hypothetical protein